MGGVRFFRWQSFSGKKLGLCIFPLGFTKNTGFFVGANESIARDLQN